MQANGCGSEKNSDLTRQGLPRVPRLKWCKSFIVGRANDTGVGPSERTQITAGQVQPQDFRTKATIVEPAGSPAAIAAWSRAAESSSAGGRIAACAISSAFAL
jgi:hypothetical protein